MSPLRTLLIVLASSLLLAPLALAQPQPGDLGVFFDPAGTQTTTDVAELTTFSFYVIGFDLGPIEGFEIGVSIYPSFMVLGMTVVDNPIGCDPGPCGPSDWIVGLGRCVDDSPAHVLLQGSAMVIMHEHNMPICVGPVSNSSLDPPRPAYASCTAGLLPFGLAENGQGVYPDGCGIVSPTRESPIDIGEASWGSVKARFDR